MSSTAAQTHYQTLGVSQDATPEQIKKAFRTLARQHHPDVLAGSSPDSLQVKDAGERFKRITHAHDVLSDPAKRRSYDFELQRLAFPGEAGIRVDFATEPGSVRFNSPMSETLSQEDLFNLIRESLFAQMHGAPSNWGAYAFANAHQAAIQRTVAAMRRFTTRIEQIDRFATLGLILFPIWVIITWISGTGPIQLLLSTASRPDVESPVPIFGILIGVGVGMLASTLLYLYARRKWQHGGFQLVVPRARMFKAIKDLSNSFLVMGAAVGLIVGRFFF